MSRKTAMAFQQMPCARCKATRILGTACPDCGLPGPVGEVNKNVVRRRSGLRKIRERTNAETVLETEAGTLPTRSEMMPLVGRLAHAISDFVDSSGSDFSIDEVSRVLSQIAALRSRLSRLTPYRPNIALVRATDSTLNRLELIWPAWEKVLSAPTMLEVQRLVPEAHRLQASAAEDLEQYEAVVAAVSAFEDYAEPSMVKRALKALSVAHPSLSLLNLAAEGASRAKRALEVPVGAGKGVEYLAISAIAEAHLDPRRFEHVLKETAVFCFQNEHLQEVAKSPGALEGLAASQRSLLETLRAFESVVQTESNPDTLLRRMISVYGEIFEDVAAPLFAWYCRLAGLKLKPYEALMAMNATDLSSALLRSPATKEWFTGAEAHLRNAAGHGRSSYSIADGRVAFKLNSYSETVAIEALIDQVFSFFESLASSSWSLGNALDQAGIEMPMSRDDAAYAGSTDFDFAVMWLEGSGETVIEAQEEGRNWIFILGAGESSASMAALSLALKKDADLQSVTVRRAGSPDPALTIPVERLEDLLTLDGAPPEDRLASQLRLNFECHSDGHPTLTRDNLEYALRVFGLSLIAKQTTSLKHMRLVRKIAQAGGHARAAALSDRVFAEFRNPDKAKAIYLARDLNSLNSNAHPEMPSSNNACATRSQSRRTIVSG